jgi:hypothetical protein
LSTLTVLQNLDLALLPLRCHSCPSRSSEPHSTIGYPAQDVTFELASPCHSALHVIETELAVMVEDIVLALDLAPVHPVLHQVVFAAVVASEE